MATTIPPSVPTVPAYVIFRWWELAVLLVTTSVAITLTAASPQSSTPAASIADALLLVVMAYALIRDGGRGIVSLRGRIPWQRLQGKIRTYAVLAVVLCFPVVVIIYLLLATRDAWTWHQGRYARCLARIAELERELGLAPSEKLEKEKVN